MRRHGVLRYAELTGDFTGRHPGGFVADQQSEHLQPGFLCQSTERSDSRIVFHPSSIMDILFDAIAASSYADRIFQHPSDRGFLGRLPP